MLPCWVGEGIRDPRIASVCIIFYENKTAAWTEIPTQELQYGVFLADKVEGVCHDDAVKWGQVKSLCKICKNVLNMNSGEGGTHCSFLLSKGVPVSIDRVDVSCGPDQIGKC